MKINDLLRSKGGDVATIDGAATVTDVLAHLAEHDIGALVVVDANGIVGMISERDVVRHLYRRGADVLAVPVSDIMTRTVATCSGDDAVDVAMRTMTDRRVRHLPVVDASGLIGIVSIGDVVKSRIDELQSATDQLEHYISGG